METVRTIAVDLAPVVGVLLALLTLWLTHAALAGRRSSRPRPAPPGLARIPGPRAGGRHRARESTRR